jgi:glycosyltransferase involved in cell wall biosynthesis
MCGATGRLMHDLARHFVKTGYRVTILTTTTGKPSISARGPISIIRLKGSNKRRVWNTFLDLYRLYKAILSNPRHDVIITMADPPMLYVVGQRASKKKGCAHIHWCQDFYPDIAPALNYHVIWPLLSLAVNLGRAALQATDCVVCISRCMQRYMVRAGVDLRHTAVIENWPDHELLDNTPPEPIVTTIPVKNHKKRRLYSDPAGQKFRVLYAGSISRAHPIEAIITAARILQKTQPDVELVFAGKGPGYEKLAAARAQYMLDNIKLMPPQPRMALRSLMESGDIHLVTMRDESLGMLLPSKFYSAVAVARPIVFAGPAECDVANFIARFACGQVVKPDDGRALATAIALYRTDSDAWFTAHEGAKQALVGRLPDDAFARWSDVVRKVLHERAR